MNLDIPNRAFFTFESECPRLPDTSFMGGHLTGWPEQNRLPDLMAIDGRQAYADVYVGWRDDGQRKSVAW